MRFDPSQITTAFSHLDWASWDFNIFANATTDALKDVAGAVFDQFNVLDDLGISSERFDAFVVSVAATLRGLNSAVQMHSFIGAVDALQGVGVLLQHGISNYLSPMDIYGVLFAALIMYTDHDGKSSGMHVASMSGLALEYNDASPVQHRALATAFALMKPTSGDGIFSDLPTSTFQDLRSIIIPLVLSTDESEHFDVNAGLSGLVLSEDELPSKSNRVMLMKAMLQVVEVGKVCRSNEVYSKWISAEATESEWLTSVEARLGLPSTRCVVDVVEWVVVQPAGKLPVANMR